MKTVIIDQARMTSTRLPGKVLKTVLGKPLLEYQIERLQRVELADALVIATTTNTTDDPIVELCDRLGVKYYRGSEADVLARYYEAAQKYQADVVVRVTSDCPLIDPKIVDRVIQFYLDQRPQCDYASNCLKRTYPRGMDTEVFSFDNLSQAYLEATANPDREHVTPFFLQNPERFCLMPVIAQENYSYHRWTVDTKEDFKLIKKILEAIYEQKQHFTMNDCIELLNNNPSWQAINAHIEQKQYAV
ncbi:glycosyltransferase family protein [Spirulina sp. CS-785/01]|uniref:glycosyltransferase family protein n=1 Tax=Spirulina sp. CS-785/01 TaxID=3021716 RepID=UPI00232CC647|nr:glycosyltransferase family protein [Spirulina sp. CS-785/01]MDB9312961.1 glycosyltransferase family protein [Spirulina sp. CS-785/01]